MSEFPIQIDATQLFYRFFIIPRVTPNFVDSREVQTVQLAPGIYNFQIASGLFADFTFTVKPDGNVDYDIDCDSFLKGRGTSTLTILGLEVTIEALRLTGADPARPDETGVLLANTPLTNEDWIAHRTVHIVPGKGYSVQPGSGLVGDFTFDLKRDGTFAYDPTMDSSQGGFLSGSGTSTLTFQGYPLTVDATAVSKLLIIQGVNNFPASNTGKATVVLLPAKGYSLQFVSGRVSDLIFSLGIDGVVNFEPSLAGFFNLEKQGEQVTLRVKGAPIQIDARELFYRFFIIPGVTPNFVDSREVQTVQLAPGIYNFQIASGLFADFTFTVKPDGNVDYDIDCDSFLKGRGTSTLTILGLEVTIEALRLTGADPARPDETGVLLANTPLTNEDWIAHRTVHIVPGKGYSVQPDSALVASFTFDLKRDGTFDYNPAFDSSQGGFLAGKGTNKLTFLGYLLTVDATALSDLLIISVRNFPPSHTGKADAVLLPLNGYPMQLASGAPSNLSFNVELNGNISFDPSLSNSLTLKNGVLTVLPKVERWVILPEGSSEEKQADFAQILAVHAALLNNGKVLFFGGSEHVLDSTLQSVGDSRIDNTRIWDPATGMVARVSSPQPPTPQHLYDLFCCGHAFLPDGRLLVGGGTSAYPPGEGDHHHEHYRGSRRTSIFNPVLPVESCWIPAGEMVQPPPSELEPGAGPNPDGSVGGGGRWYPTLIALPDRTVAAFGGHPQAADQRHSNYSVEVFSPDQASGGSWRLTSEEPQAVQAANVTLQRPEVFPRAHVLPNGRVFLACLIDGNSYSWDPYNRPSALDAGWEKIATFPSGSTSPDPDQSNWTITYFDTGRPRYSRSFFAWSSVLLPLLPEDGYSARVLIVGRQQPFFIELGRPNDPWPPAVARWEPTTPRDASDLRLFMPSPHRPTPLPETEFPGRGDSPGGKPTRYSNVVGMRQQCFAILLPDATVLVVGGSTTHPEDWSGYFFDGVLLPEVFDPATGHWRTIKSEATVPRVYHGVALLLQDGRVWTAGSNPWGDGQAGLFRNDGRDGDWEERIEIFEPWYFSEQRPVITDTPDSVRHGLSFELQSPQAGSIRRVAMIKACSVTHGEVFDQRYIGLKFQTIAGDRLRVWAPPHASIAPPGYYLIFIIDSASVPSVGGFVRVSLGWEPWFALGPNVFRVGALVTALSGAPGATSLFLVGLDNEGLGGGKVFTKFFPDPTRPGQWSDWLALEDRDPSARRVFPVGASVTALSGAPGATSLFVVGLDNEGLGGGKVFTKFFPDPTRPGQWSDWLALEDRDPSVRRVFPVGAAVTALSTAPGATSLFLVGLDNEGLGGGKVFTKFFPDPTRPGQWSDWLALEDRDPSVRRVFPTGAAVTALSTAPGATSLFLVGLDNEGLGGGKVFTKFFPDPTRPGQWSDWLALEDRDPSVRRVFPAGATVTGLSTAPGTTSLYVVGLGGKVFTKFFPDPTRPGQWSDWFALGDNVFPVGSTITARSLSKGATSLYVVGLDGQIWSNFFPSDGRPEWSGWFALGPNTFPIRSRIAAESPAAGETSLFVTGIDGQVWSSFFDPLA